MKLEFSWKIFEKSSNIKLHENPSIGSQLFHAYGRTDRDDAANSQFSQFCERAEKGKVFLRFRDNNGRANAPPPPSQCNCLSCFLTTYTYLKLLISFTGCDILCGVCRWLAPVDVKRNSDFPCAYRHKLLYQTLQTGDISSTVYIC